MAKIRFLKESELVFKEKPKVYNFKDLTGQKFGKLTVLGYAGMKSHSQWYCRCECGNFVKTGTCNLKSGNTNSCTCLQKEVVRQRSTTHGHTGNGQVSKTYTAWQAMLSRCQAPNYINFKNYGGRGINVCKRWQKFENFLEDMGERPDGLSLDRIENDKGYYKENCRWATRIEQQNNRRNNRKITFNSKTQTLAQWEQELGLNKCIVSGRLRLGWSVEMALTTPVKN